MSRKKFYPKYNPQEKEASDHVFDLARRRSSWITRPLFDAVYPTIEPGPHSRMAEEVETALVAELSAEEPEPVPTPSPAPLPLRKSKSHKRKPQSQPEPDFSEAQ